MDSTAIVYALASIIPWAVLNRFTGGLADNTKLPAGPARPSRAWAWGIPARHCKTGGRLRRVAGSVCRGCYAMAGRYIMPFVSRAYDRRFRLLSRALTNDNFRPVFTVALAVSIAKTQQPFFRFHDSGDFQNRAHYDILATVARLLPGVMFWVPTKEPWAVHIQDRPANLIVRYGMPLVDSMPGPRMLQSAPVSVVVRDVATVASDPRVTACRAYDGPGPHGCGDCRSCWDPTARIVAYAFRD